MGTAAKIRTYRVRAGKSAGEVAERLGLNDSWYADLEQRDDELASTLSLFQGMELASILGVHLRDLFSDGGSNEETIPILELPGRINAHVAREEVSIEQFEDQVGWELREFLSAPIKGAAELPILFIQAVASPLGINWLSLVPDEEAD
jgi:transcriptional regulator with XRE-family HTH domain